MSDTLTDKPLAIAILGAPGSGKHEIADTFAMLASQASLVPDGFAVLATPTEEISNVERPLGREGNYDTNLMLATKQLEAELKARIEHKSFLTVGTIIQRLAHGAVRLEQLALGISTPEGDQEKLREGTTTTVLSCLLIDSMNYSFIFYVPAKETLFIPGEEENPYNQRVDGAIQQALRSFRVPAIVLDEGTNEEKAQKMLEIVTSGVEMFNQQQREAQRAADPNTPADIDGDASGLLVADVAEAD